MAACAGLAVFGMVLVLLGTLFSFPEMRERLKVDLALLLLLLYFGVLISTIFVGPLIDRFGNRLVLSFSSFFVALALSTFAWANSSVIATVAAVVLGMGGGGLNTATNALVSDLYKKDRGAKLSILAMFFGIGALGVPLLAASISQLISIPRLLVLASVPAALCGAVYLVLPFPEGREAHSFSIRGAARAIGYPGVLLLAVLLFFESGNESSFNGWTTTWAGAIGASSRMASLIFAIFQGSMMLGRLVTVRLLRHVEKINLVIGSSASAIVACLVLLLSHSVTGMIIGVVMAGFALAAIYPTVLAIAGDRYQHFAGTVFGTLFAISLTAGMVFPWTIGHVSKSVGAHFGIVLPLIGTVMTCIMALIIRGRVVPAELRDSEPAVAETD